MTVELPGTVAILDERLGRTVALAPQATRRETEKRCRRAVARKLLRKLAIGSNGKADEREVSRKLLGRRF